ncbi:MAG: TAXI family TRAP transporter solute-binding subunit, partial [Planctomycetota bacterium]|nr:TAXI family TRAP transporter solute-binding subunit [Planctomycetota bacterium]
AQESTGSVKNVTRIVDGSADVAFIAEPALFVSSAESKEKIRVLSRLYIDTVQIVVRKDANIKKLADIQNHSFFGGQSDSATHIVTEFILKEVGVTKDPSLINSFDEASKKLVSGAISAAFFVTGAPTKAVANAMESGQCELLDLSELYESLKKKNPLALKEIILHKNLYINQPKAVHTLGTDVYLICRRELDAGLAQKFVSIFFDNLEDLLTSQTTVGDVSFRVAQRLPDGLKMHPGAIQFFKEERNKLQIATGSIGSKYYELGKMIKMLLEQSGIESRLVATDGSVENAQMLSESPTIAIMQYDIALATRFSSNRVYSRISEESMPEIQSVPNIRRIAMLHEEKVHVIARRSVIKKLNEKNAKRRLTLDVIKSKGPKKLKVCLGAVASGTAILAQAVLEKHGIQLSDIDAYYYSVPQMVERILNGDVDVAFFVSFIPSEGVKSLLNDPDVILLSMRAENLAGVIGSAFSTSMIEPGTYLCQRKDELPIQTISTKAVLTTTSDLPFNVKEITKSVFGGAAFLGTEGGQKRMAENVSSLPLHEGSKEYYEEANLLPSKKPLDWLGLTWKILATLGAVLGLYRGFVEFKRRRLSARLSLEILAVGLDTKNPHAVKELRRLRRKLRGFVQVPMWSLDELDWQRWRNLHDLANERMLEMKEELFHQLLLELRELNPGQGPIREFMKQSHQLKRRIWTCAVRGELSHEQHEMLDEFMKEILEDREKSRESAVFRPDSRLMQLPEIREAVDAVKKEEPSTEKEVTKEIREIVETGMVDKESVQKDPVAQETLEQEGETVEVGTEQERGTSDN